MKHYQEKKTRQAKEKLTLKPSGKLLKLNSMIKKHFTIKKSVKKEKKMLRILELILIIID